MERARASEAAEINASGEMSDALRETLLKTIGEYASKGGEDRG